jgi:hypothetical protein
MRKKVEAESSQIKTRMLRSIPAVTQWGLPLKAALLPSLLLSIKPLTYAKDPGWSLSNYITNTCSAHIGLNGGISGIGWFDKGSMLSVALMGAMPLVADRSP